MAGELSAIMINVCLLTKMQDKAHVRNFIKFNNFNYSLANKTKKNKELTVLLNLIIFLNWLII